MVQEEYRVRTGYHVRFDTPTIYELLETDKTIVDIDGTTVAFDIDMSDVEITEPHDRNFTIGTHYDVRRLLSGFPIQYYSVLGDEDLIITYDHRLDGEEIIEDRAGGLVTFDEFVEKAPDHPVTEFRIDEVPDDGLFEENTSNDTTDGTPMSSHWG